MRVGRARRGRKHSGGLIVLVSSRTGIRNIHDNGRGTHARDISLTMDVPLVGYAAKIGLSRKRRRIPCKYV